MQEDMLSGRLIKEWPELVGERVAKNVRFFRLKDGEITLLTTSSAWRFELFSLRDEIIKKCNEYLNIDAVNAVKIR
jgi:predicted nucleic acid-binding Zn ribbon protein